MRKEIKKFVKRRIGWYAIRGFLALNGILPLCLSYFMGEVLGNIAYFLVRRHRKIALDSLSVAFPDKPLKEKKQIARSFFVFMAQGSFELLHLLKKPDELSYTRIQDRKHLDKALERKKGVVLLTAHLGNFPLMSLKLAKEGYPANIVVRQMRDTSANDYFHSLRVKAGVKTIFALPRRDCINGIIKALRNNEIVIMLMDLNFGSGGVWVKFFDKLAATPIGPIVLAARTDAAVVPAYIYRESKKKHCIRIFPQEELITADNKDQATLLNAIKFTRIIEDWIRKYAWQWGWIHRRWKTPPSKKDKETKFKIEK